MFFFIRRQHDGFALQMYVTIVCKLTDFNLNYHPKKNNNTTHSDSSRRSTIFFFSKAKKKLSHFWVSLGSDYCGCRLGALHSTRCYWSNSYCIIIKFYSRNLNKIDALSRDLTYPLFCCRSFEGWPGRPDSSTFGRSRWFWILCSCWDYPHYDDLTEKAEHE